MHHFILAMFVPGISMIATGFITCETPHVAVAVLTAAAGAK